MFQIRVLGELELAVDGRPLALPASRKTRALLAFLAMSKRAYQRNRLCEIFWEVPDDPRAALRWSLSKLRPLTTSGERERLRADREHASLELDPGELDLDIVRETIAAGIERASTEALANAAELYRGELLEGLDLSGCPHYFEWCKAERESARALHTQILIALVERTQDDPEARLRYARRRVAIDPYAEDAHVLLIELLAKLGRTREALAQYDDCARVLEQELRVQPSTMFIELRRKIGAAVPQPSSTNMLALARDSTSVGRASERVRVEHLLRDREEHRVLFIEGEPGIGKTHFLRGLEERVRMRGGAAITTRAFEAEMIRPYGVWIDALRASPELAALAPELSPSPSPAIASQTQLFDAVKRAIAGVSLVVVDDIQWIDEPSAALLHYAIRALEGAPILFALAARTGELADNPAAHRLVRALDREERAEHVELGPLDDAEVAALVRAIAGEVEVERIVAQSGGNPLYAIELAAQPDASELGSSRLEQLLMDRIDRLPGSARDVALWAAAFGRPFSPELLARAIGISAGEIVSALGELEKRAIIRPLHAQSFEYDFAHDLLRRRAYRQLSQPRRRMVHLRLAQALVSIAASERADIAHHAALGGDRVLAARSYLAAGERSLQLFAHAEAARVAYRGLDQLQPEVDDRELVLHISLLKLVVLSGVELHHSQDLEGRLSTVADRARLLGRDAEAAEALWVRSLISHESGNFDRAEAAVLEIVATAGAETEPAARARALANVGRCLAQIERDMERAGSLLDEAAEIARNAGVEVEEIDWGIGLIRHHKGDLDDAIVRLSRAFESSHARSDHWAECECLSRMAMIELERGAIDRALERCAELSFVATKMGDGSEGLAAKALEAVAALISGQPGAEERIEAALGPLRVVDAKGILAYVLLSAALIEVEQDRVALARARAEEALRAAEVLRRPSLVAIARAVLARAALIEGTGEIARAHLDAARAIRDISAHARAVLSAVEST